MYFEGHLGLRLTFTEQFCQFVGKVFLEGLGRSAQAGHNRVMGCGNLINPDLSGEAAVFQNCSKWFLQFTKSILTQLT